MNNLENQNLSIKRNTKQETKIKKLIKKEFNKDIEVIFDQYRIILNGNVDSYEEKYQIGRFLHKKKYLHIVNDLIYPSCKEQKIHSFNLEDKSLDNLHVDVLVVGGGVIGAATLRELSKYDLDVLLIEKEEDVAMHQSSHNDGCIHVGFDLKSKSKKLEYLNRSRKILPDLLKELNIDYVFNCQTVAFTSSFYQLIYALLKLKAKKNKIEGGIKFLSKKKLKELEPNISDEIKCAITLPGGGSFSPYLFTIALSEVALNNGAKISLKTILKEIETKDNKIVSVLTNKGRIYPKVLINCAGVFSDEIAKMANDQTFTIHPRKGTDILFDHNETNKLSKTQLTIFNLFKRDKNSKGGGLIPTIDGNILLGPDAIEVENKEDYSVNKENIDKIIKKHQKTMPLLNHSGVIAYFSGTRASSYEEDFEIRKGIYTKNIVHGAAIQSPGLSCAPAIANDLVKFTLEILGETKKKEKFNAIRAKQIEVRKLSFKERDELIKKDPRYGHIICRCEEISEGEIVDAILSPLRPSTIDAIKRRTRAGMGRCQGGFCQMKVLSLIAYYNNLKMEEVNKKGEGKIIFRDLKG